MSIQDLQKILDRTWTLENQKKFLAGRSLLLTPWQAGPLYQAMGLLNKEGKLSHDQMRKAMQVNHMLQLLLPALKKASQQFPVLSIVDAACGQAYLSLALAWYLKHILKKPFTLLGVDREASFLQRVAAKVEAIGLHEQVAFVCEDLQNFSFASSQAKFFPDSNVSRPHFVVALHACDTATDFALALALKERSDYLAVAPCCQAELAAIWKRQPKHSQHAFSPIFASPHFRRTVADDMTDMLRMLRLRSRGYEVTATEFVASEHSVKNRLLLGEKRGRYWQTAAQEWQDLHSQIGKPDLALERLLQETDELSSPAATEDQDINLKHETNGPLAAQGIGEL